MNLIKFSLSTSFIYIYCGDKGPIWYTGPGPYLVSENVRGEANDWKSPRMEDHVREDWRGKVQGGYPSWIGRTSDRQITK